MPERGGERRFRRRRFHRSFALIDGAIFPHRNSYAVSEYPEYFAQRRLVAGDDRASLKIPTLICSATRRLCAKIFLLCIYGGLARRSIRICFYRRRTEFDQSSDERWSALTQRAGSVRSQTNALGQRVPLNPDISHSACWRCHTL